MDDAKFDRLVRALSTIHTRRGIAAIAGGFAGTVGLRVARGAQPGAATCGAEGAACTLIVGCCDGLTCVTSAINSSYGVCVPGDGGIVSSGTTLISPFSESAVDEATALLEEATTAPATDPLAERKARIADSRARRDANLAARRARLDAKRSANNTPRVKPARGPRLKLKLILSSKDDPVTDDPTHVPVETVVVTNVGDVSTVLTRIESLLAPEDGVSLTTSLTEFTLSPGEAYFFVSGLTPSDPTDGRYDWTIATACDGSLGAGYLVKAALNSDSKNRNFKILCNRAHGAGAVKAASETSPRPRTRNGQQQKKKR